MMLQRTMVLIASMSVVVVLPGCGEWKRISGKHEHNAQPSGESPDISPMQNPPKSPDQTTATPVPVKKTDDALPPPEPTPAPTPAKKDIGFAVCNVTGSGLLSACQLKPGDLAPVQSSLSQFKVTYRFHCALGLDLLAMKTELVGPVVLNNASADSADSSVITLFGFGPLDLVSGGHNGKRLEYSLINSDCNLDIQKVDITPISQLSTP